LELEQQKLYTYQAAASLEELCKTIQIELTYFVLESGHLVASHSGQDIYEKRYVILYMNCSHAFATMVYLN